MRSLREHGLRIGELEAGPRCSIADADAGFAQGAVGAGMVAFDFKGALTSPPTVKSEARDVARALPARVGEGTSWPARCPSSSRSSRTTCLGARAT
jgi:hypothetical protein